MESLLHRLLKNAFQTLQLAHQRFLCGPAVPRPVLDGTRDRQAEILFEQPGQIL
ncbi:DUF1743 domain-containing protein [Methylococcus sp. EFPC2]|uniref:TiaS agmantine-binding domain-containing protein n=1 Tax=Methylococcus sp. EFPC2 TaxID=2812648 RepID=UPI00352FF8A6